MNIGTTKTGFRGTSINKQQTTRFRDVEKGIQAKNAKREEPDEQEEEEEEEEDPYDEEGKYHRNSNEGNDNGPPPPTLEEESEEENNEQEEEVLSDENIRKLVRAKNFKQKIHEYTKQKMGVHTSIVLCMIFATLFLVLISNSLSAAHIIILSLLVGFALILKEGINKKESVVAPELVTFCALWLFWLVYSYGNFAIEEDSNPFISTIIHWLFTILFYLFPIYIVFQLIARNRLYVQYLNMIVIVQAIACIFPFYDNNAFHHLTDSLIRIICASFLYALMFYYYTMSKFEFSIHCSIIQLFYVFFGHSIVSLLFFAFHFGLYIYKVLRLMYNVGTQIQENRQKKNIFNRSLQYQKASPPPSSSSKQPPPSVPRKTVNRPTTITTPHQQTTLAPPSPSLVISPTKSISIKNDAQESSASNSFLNSLVN